jgi:hypothetical protein
MRHRKLVSVLLLVVAHVAIWTSNPLSPASAWQEEEKVLRVYPIADLLTPTVVANPGNHWPGTGLLAPATGTGMGGGGMGSGMGGGMGGMGGGGGMFAIPSNLQEGGMGGMGGGMGGMGGGAGGMGGGVGFGYGQTITTDNGYELHVLIDQFLSNDDSYDNSGLTLYNGMLVAKQTESCHEQIAQILKVLRDGLAQRQVIQVEWAALALEPVDAQRLAHAQEQQVFQELIDQHAVVYGSISTLNGHLAFSSSGEHRNLVLGVTPVVGTFQDGVGAKQSGVGYQPQTTKPVLGWLAQVRPLVPSEIGQPGMIQVGVSKVSKPENERTVPVVGVPDSGDLPAFQAVGTIKAMPNTWTVLGGMAVEAEVAAVGAPKYVIVVRYSF